MTTRRGLFPILIIGTMVLFIGLVWVIVRFVPWNRLNTPAASQTAGIARVGMNCTYPVTYWGQHPELYPSQVVLGSKTYSAKDLSPLLTDASQEPSARLQAQLVGAFLNVQSGADQAPIESMLFQAYGWLEEHPDGSEVTGSELEAGARLSDLLQVYNLGLAGVIPCRGASIYALTETSSISGLSTSVSTPTPTQTLTPTPSETPTAIGTPLSHTATATYRALLPTATRTTEPPVQQPTTNPIATVEPPATSTPNPPATPTEKPVPTDTPMPTLPPPTPTLPVIPTLPY